jgi:hypothetical protein
MQPPKQPATPLIVKETALNFGEATEQQSFAWDIPIYNSSSSELQIIDITSSCECTSIQPRSLVISAKSTELLHLHLDLTSKGPTETNSATRPFSAEIIIHLGSEGSRSEQEIRWQVHGSVRKIISFNPSIIDFGDGLHLGAIHPTRTVAVTAHFPIENIEAQSSSPQFSTHITKDSRMTSQFLLHVTPSNDLPLGPFNADIQIKPVLHDGNPLSTSTLLARGSIVSDLQFLPSTLPFGRAPIGTTLSATVLVRSKSGRHLYCFAEATEHINVTALDAENQSHVSFRISINVATTGKHSEAIPFIAYYSDDDTIQTLSLQLSYFGTPKDLPKTAER